MCANIEDPEVIKSLGARNLDGAVIAISENFGTSIMATIMAKEIGIPYVLAKAQSSLHATVLKKWEQMLSSIRKRRWGAVLQERWCQVILLTG